MVSLCVWPFFICVEGYQREESVRRPCSGECRLQARSIWQLAKYTGGQFIPRDQKMFAARCRELQASSLWSPEMSATIIRDGRVIDPANQRDEIADLYIDDGRIVGSKSEIRNPQSATGEIDARNL